MCVCVLQKRKNEIKEIRKDKGIQGQSKRDARVTEGIDNVKEITLSCEKKIKVPAKDVAKEKKIAIKIIMRGYRILSPIRNQ